MIVIDTNVISEAMAVAPNATVSRWLSSQHGPMLFTTTISIAEILYGLELLPGGKLRLSAEAMFARLFTGRVLIFDEAAARAFLSIAVERRLRGRPITMFDAQ